MAPPAPSGGEGSFFAKKLGPLPVWAWAGIALLGVYLYRKYTSGSTATTATTTASTGTAPPTETITTAGGTYTGPVNAAPGSITNPTTASTTDTGATSPGTGATSPGNGGGTPGQATATTTTVPTGLPGAVNIGGQSLIPIGTITGAGGQYYGYEVGGGAPVLFGPSSGASAAQLNGPAGIEAEPVGTEVYTPASNASAISATQGSAKF